MDKERQKDRDKNKKSEESIPKSKEPKSKSKPKEVPSETKEKSVKSPKKSKDHKDVALEKSLSQISMMAPPVPESLCEMHKGAYVYYCQTCEEVVCNQCITFGPHNNQYHRIIKMNDAYKQKVFGMSECFRLSLIAKREKLIQHLQKYEHQIEQIKRYKNGIERETRSQYGGHLEKLKLSEGSKSALILYEISTLQKEINGMNDLGTKFYQMTNVVNIPQGEQPEKYICKFLAKSKQLYQAVEYYLNKPVRPYSSINVEDLPNQLERQREMIDVASSIPHVNQFRAECIWRLANKEEFIKREFESKADTMIRGLSEDADFLNNKLKEYNLICVFCGQVMSETNVNSGCNNNFPDSHSLQTKVSDQMPPETKVGNHRHYFCLPNTQQLKKSILM